MPNAAPPETRRKRVETLALLCALLCSSTLAQAVMQPSGVTIPVLAAAVTTCDDKNVQMCLDASEGGPGIVSAQADALTAPETFQPTCQLTFQPIVKGGYNNAGFGWYNVKPDPANVGKYLKPLQTELYGMLFLNTHQQTGAQVAGLSASLDLAVERAAGRYSGGQIGFFLASGPYTFDPQTRALSGTINELFFTQHELNPGSGVAKPYLQVLTWQSVKHPQGFYFGWEDQTASLSSDNDFDDLVFLVSGIQCSGSGDACDTGMLGVCALGTQQCRKGAVSCVQSVQGSAEKCNALDDDCDGMVDDGDDLCAPGEVCDRGRCVPKCGSAEFRCATGTVCSSHGVCVEKECAQKDCPAGQVCQAGNCIDGCTGVTCPHGQECRGGGCIDPCQGVTCDEGYACVLGVCQSCECTACGAGQTCKSNVCVDSGCETQSCAPGSHCQMGGCVDDCQGAACPKGQLCMLGDCVADPSAAPSNGSDPADPVVIVQPMSSAGSSSVGSASGGSAAAVPTLGSSVPQGCGCAVPGRSSGGSYAAALLLLALAGRRKRATSSLGKRSADRR